MEDFSIVKTKIFRKYPFYRHFFPFRRVPVGDFGGNTMKNTFGAEAKMIKDAKILAFLSGKKRTCLELALCILCGWAYCTIFEGFSCHILAWVGILPLFILVYARTPKRAFFYGFLWGYFWHLGSFFWLREIFIAIPFALAAVLGFFNGVFAMFIPFFFKYLLVKQSSLSLEADQRNSFDRFPALSQILFSFAAASLWTILEYIRSHIFTGLPWNLLGASQWKMLTIIQIADITGIYGITFLIVFMNSSLFPLFLYLAGSFFSPSSPVRTAFPMPCPGGKGDNGKRFVYQRPASLLFALALIAAASSYSFVSLRKYGRMSQKGTLFHAGIVQPDLSQRRHGSDESTKEALAVCTALSEALFQPGKTKPHAVLWPETAVPCPFNAAVENSALLRQELYRMILQYDTPFLFGAIRLDKHPEKQELLIYNSALLWKKGNHLSSFDKVHIVPFGEYVPFGDKYPILNRLVGMGRNLNRGTHFTPLQLSENVRAGVSVCYEDVFPYVSRNHVLNGANLLLTITNDAWYPTSFEPSQHFVNSLFRAIECRLPFLRVGNMDYSALIAPTGQVIQALAVKENGSPDPSFRGRKSGILSVYVPEKVKPTFYVKYRDVFTGICLFLFLFMLAAVLFNYKNFKTSILDSFNEKETPHP